MKLSAHAILFDLDGTLIDSAPDLAGAGNEMRVARGLPELPFAQFRPMVGAGARGMLRIALKVAPNDTRFEELREEFFSRYEKRMTQETHLFADMCAVLAEFESRGLPWGIVTNKARRFTEPIVRALGLQERAATVVSGDTTAHAKPHPAPLLEAARQLGLAAADCVYVGDDLRDMQAGKAAGMQTVAASWGYLGVGEHISGWGADHVIQKPIELLKLLAMA